MKNKVALLMIFIFTLSLFSPTVLAWDRDWNNPRYSNSAYSQSTEMDPWIEGLNDPNNIQTIAGVVLFLEAAKLYISCYWGIFTFKPQVIIVKKKQLNRNTDNNKDENNTNTNTGTGTPSGE